MKMRNALFTVPLSMMPLYELLPICCVPLSFAEQACPLPFDLGVSDLTSAKAVHNNQFDLTEGKCCRRCCDNTKFPEEVFIHCPGQRIDKLKRKEECRIIDETKLFHI